MGPTGAVFQKTLGTFRGTALTTGCTNCHDKERTLVGPAFTVIAARYAAQPEAEKTIAKSLVHGSNGKWGPTPMPPQPRLEPEEQRAMIAWILSLER